MALVQDFLEYDHCPKDCPGKMVLCDGVVIDTMPPILPTKCDVCGERGSTCDEPYPRVVSREVEP